MGRRGPPPTPAGVLKLRGSWRAKKPLDGTMSPEPGRPLCPSWLSAQAKAAWKALLPELEKMGVLSKLDRNALARYVAMWDKWRECIEFMDKHGSIYPVKDADGKQISVKEFPQVSMALRYSEQMLRLEQQFGLTPSARTRIKQDVREGKKTDDEEEKREAFFGA